MDEMRDKRPEPGGGPEKAVLDESRVFLLQGGIAGDGGMWGTVFNVCGEKTAAFRGLDEAILIMNRWLTERASPSEDMGLRSFCLGRRKRRRTLSGRPAQPKVILIRKEAFLIRVFYNEHTSWQGMVCWRSQRQYFRSVLELMSLIRSVLAEQEGAGESREAAESQNTQLPGKAV